MLEIKRILFPCDLTEISKKILPYVLSIAEKYDSTICLFHVVQDLHAWGALYVPHTSLGLDQQKLMEAAEKLMDDVCDEHLESCPNFQRRIVSGDPADELIKILESESFDLIIMGTHGRKGLERTIFGSVAEKVVKRSPVPVLMVNPAKIK